MLPGLRLEHPQLDVRAFERVRQGHRKQSTRLVVTRLGQKALQRVIAQARPCGVMYQDPIRRPYHVARGDKPVEDTCRSGLTATVKWLDPPAKLAPVAIPKVRVALGKYNQYLLDPRVSHERPQRMV